MSLQYLESLLPLPAEKPVSKDASTEPFKDLSEQELGVLSAQFERFSDTLRPFREQLVPIERFLEQFDAEIEHLSESLRALQTQSHDLSMGLDGHRILVEKLNPVILDLVIPPGVARSVLKDPIDEKWVENVNFITEKQQLARKISAGGTTLEYKDSKALAELEHGISVLEAKAIERIRNHIIEQIRVLRRSVSTSSQAVQRHLLQIKDTYAFLKARHPQLAAQLQLAYVYTMRWYYTSRFAKYLHSLQKLRLKNIDSTYVLGHTGEAHDTAKAGFFDTMAGGYTNTNSTGVTATGSAGVGSTTSSSAAAPTRVTLSEYFSSVPKRMAVLAEDDDAQRAIPSQIAETTPFAYWLEFAFDQFSTALLDNVIVEYLFAIDFFYQGSEKFDVLPGLDPRSKPADKKKNWSHVMFEEVFKMGHAYANWLVSSSHQTLGSRIASGSAAYASGAGANAGTCDSFAVLLMIRIIQKQDATLHNQFHVPVMEDYHNALLLSLWPHFTRIIDINCDALKRNILGKSSYLHSSSGASHAPIHTTQQFAQFLSGLFKLAFADNNTDEENSKQLYSREPISMSINRLRNDYEGALTKASTYVFGSGKSKAAHREMFLFNNYFLLVTILANEFETTTNSFIQEQIKHFQLLCDAYKPK